MLQDTCGKESQGQSCKCILRVKRKDDDQLCKNIKEINRILVAEDTEGNDMLIRFTDFDLVRKEYAAMVEEILRDTDPELFMEP